MAELYPAPFGNLLRRVRREWDTRESLFDLKAKSFYRGDPALDTSVRFLGRPAATPVGPAAGPQSQLAQNIVLAWLAGARILELKTVQIMDRLEIPRPCIFAGNVGFNVEWSQELRLAESLEEYVKASMLIDILRDSRMIGDSPGPEKDAVVYDMSVGYDLKGIRSPEITGWIRAMTDAREIVDRLRREIPEELARYRDFDFRTRIADTITLSTFHGCPADEIEKIVHYLITELGIDTVIKLNPTLLGKPRIDHLLHDLLGYHEVETDQAAFDKDLQFADALDIVRRLTETALRCGRRVGVKFTNTLVVKNHDSYFSDPVMYLSGAPLHVISLTLAETFRRALGFELPVSFSAGIDRQNFPDAVACGFTPITTCTDLLKTGGYGRLAGYLTHLEERMRKLGVRNVADYVVAAEGNGGRAIREAMEELAVAAMRLYDTHSAELAAKATVTVADLEADLLANLAGGDIDLGATVAVARDTFEASLGAAFASSRFPALIDGLHGRIVHSAGLANLRPIVERTQQDPRYRKEKNAALPRKIGSQLYLFDCINCDKCIPVCPNDANFSYETAPVKASYSNFEVSNGGVRPAGSYTFELEKSHQLANFADFCNECGNCDIFCPEDGGPYVVKPRFFGTLEAWQRHSGHDGFHIAPAESAAGYRMFGRIGGKEYLLDIDREAGAAQFTDSQVEVELAWETGEVTESRALGSAPRGHQLDMSRFYIMRSLFEGVMDRGGVNYVNVAR